MGRLRRIEDFKHLARKFTHCVMEKEMSRVTRPEQLDLNKRIVFVMHDMEQLSGPDVAAALEIPLNTVYSRLRRARAAFEAALLRIGRQEGEV